MTVTPKVAGQQGANAASIVTKVGSMFLIVIKT
jgi:hypothetical protein